MLCLSKKSTVVNLINISFLSAVFYSLRCYRCISLCKCSSKMRKCRLYIRLITLVCLACKMETKVQYLASSFVKYVHVLLQNLACDTSRYNNKEASKFYPSTD
jgi:hypothetical protein